MGTRALGWLNTFSSHACSIQEKWYHNSKELVLSMQVIHSPLPKSPMWKTAPGMISHNPDHVSMLLARGTGEAAFGSPECLLGLRHWLLVLHVMNAYSQPFFVRWSIQVSCVQHGVCFSTFCQEQDHRSLANLMASHGLGRFVFSLHYGRPERYLPAMLVPAW